MTDDSSSLSVNPARQIRRCALLVLAAGALLVLDLQLFSRAFAQPLIALGSRIEAENGRERLIFDLTGPVKISARPLTDPDRIIVDIADLEFRLDPSAGRNTANSKLIKAFRFGLFAPGRSRIIVDLAQPAAVTATRLIPVKDGSRLIIELAPTDAASFTAAAIAEGKPAMMREWGNGSMITPVEKGKTCWGFTDKAWAKASQVSLARCKPSSPVPALALPVLINKARMP